MHNRIKKQVKHSHENKNQRAGLNTYCYLAALYSERWMERKEAFLNRETTHL